MNAVLRPFAEWDVDAVLHLASRSQQAPQWNREAYENIIGSGPKLHFAYLARNLQVLCGFAIASWLPPDEPAELETVVVDVAFRRQGIGRALLQACAQAAAQAGARTIRLEVRESNRAALALYQRLDFSSVGRRRAYYSAPVEDAILMQAQLRLQSPL